MRYAGVRVKDIKESDIKRDILWYLTINKVFCWRNNTTGVFDVSAGRFRKSPTLGSPVGSSDILGIFKGKPLAIEVKKPEGKVSEKQAQFIERFNKEGGIAFVARSVFDVKRELNL